MCLRMKTQLRGAKCGGPTRGWDESGLRNTTRTAPLVGVLRTTLFIAPILPNVKGKIAELKKEEVSKYQS